MEKKDLKYSISENTATLIECLNDSLNLYAKLNNVVVNELGAEVAAQIMNEKFDLIFSDLDSTLKKYISEEIYTKLSSSGGTEF